MRFRLILQSKCRLIAGFNFQNSVHFCKCRFPIFSLLRGFRFRKCLSNFSLFLFRLHDQFFGFGISAFKRKNLFCMSQHRAPVCVAGGVRLFQKTADFILFFLCLCEQCFGIRIALIHLTGFCCVVRHFLPVFVRIFPGNFQEGFCLVFLRFDLRLGVSVKTGFQFGEGGLKIAFFVRVFALGHVRAGGGVKILCKGHGLVLIRRRLVGVFLLNQLARFLPFRRVVHDPNCRRNGLLQRFHFVVKTRRVLCCGFL